VTRWCLEAVWVHHCGYGGRCNPPARQEVWTLPLTCSSHLWLRFPPAGGGTGEHSDKTRGSDLLVKLGIFQACHGGLSVCIADVVRSGNRISCLNNFICNVDFEIILRLFFLWLLIFVPIRHIYFGFFSCIFKE